MLMYLFLVIVTQQHIAEKRFVKNSEIIRLQEYYMLCAIKQAESMLMSDNIPLAGRMEFKQGTVTFNKTSLLESVDEVTFTLILDTGERFIGIGTYDNELDRMVKWIERN
jgi:hypothetical protein